MHISRFRAVLVVAILSAIICIGSVMALLWGYYIIPSSGSIALKVAVEPSFAELYVGETRGFTATPSGGTPQYNIEWIDNATQGVIGTDTTYHFNAVQAGTYEIFARVTDNTGDTAISPTATITVTDAPPTTVPLPSGRNLSKSEIRAVFYKAESQAFPSDWALVMGTLLTYNINTIVVEAMGNNYVHYPSDYVPCEDNDYSTLINEAHARGIEVHFSMNIMLSSPGVEYETIDAGGTPTGWLCPTKAISRNHIRNLVEEVVTNYDIDGFMFDYARYDRVDVCYCPECKAKLEEYLGETITDFPGDFAPGGSRYQHEFMEWRTHPINDLVRDMRDWMRAIKPDLEFSGAVWGWIPEYPTYNRYWIGQDATYWVKEGYVDWVAPMQYTTDLTAIRDYFSGMIREMVAGPEGVVPLVAFLSTAYPEWVDPNNFKQQVDIIRQIGGDGWIIFAYGGPGQGYPYAPDIRQYLDLIDLYPRFTLKDIEVSFATDSATITWTTDLPATSKVEYSTSPLFTASFEYLAVHDFSYWDIDYIAGTTVEDATPVTSHSITLTGLQPDTVYYYRVQSQDIFNIATSKVYTFEL